ncbi:MAG: hypothetical protein ACRDIY_05845 [Chloroflexota bacterium]
MARELKTVKVSEGSEIANLLDRASAEPLLLESRGSLNRLTREPDNIWADYDPRAALEGIRKAAGSWKGVDAEAFKANLYRAREEGTRRTDYQ